MQRESERGDTRRSSIYEFEDDRESFDRSAFPPASALHPSSWLSSPRFRAAACVRLFRSRAPRWLYINREERFDPRVNDLGDVASLCASC